MRGAGNIQAGNMHALVWGTCMRPQSPQPTTHNPAPAPAEIQQQQTSLHQHGQHNQAKCTHNSNGNNNQQQHNNQRGSTDSQQDHLTEATPVQNRNNHDEGIEKTVDGEKVYLVEVDTDSYLLPRQFEVLLHPFTLPLSEWGYSSNAVVFGPDSRDGHFMIQQCGNWHSVFHLAPANYGGQALGTLFEESICRVMGPLSPLWG